MGPSGRQYANTTSSLRDHGAVPWHRAVGGNSRSDLFIRGTGAGRAGFALGAGNSRFALRSGRSGISLGADRSWISLDTRAIRSRGPWLAISARHADTWRPWRPCGTGSPGVTATVERRAVDLDAGRDLSLGRRTTSGADRTRLADPGRSGVTAFARDTGGDRFYRRHLSIRHRGRHHFGGLDLCALRYRRIQLGGELVDQQLLRLDNPDRPISPIGHV